MSTGSMSPTTPAAPYGNMPMYGMPQPNTYGQYAFGGYGTPGAAVPGLASPGGGQMAMASPGGAADPSAAAGQAAQGQWAGADPSSYYSNYWGGYYGQPGQGGDPQHPTA